MLEYVKMIITSSDILQIGRHWSVFYIQIFVQGSITPNLFLEAHDSFSLQPLLCLPLQHSRETEKEHTGNTQNSPYVERFTYFP